jgi:hypothetical protein
MTAPLSCLKPGKPSTVDGIKLKFSAATPVPSAKVPWERSKCTCWAITEPLTFSVFLQMLLICAVDKAR